MSSNSTHSNTARTLSQVLSWPDRRQLVSNLADELAEARATDVTLEEITRLAEDEKWEVRQDVANMLLLVPDPLFSRLVARLTEDRNAYVRSAAERVLQRRDGRRPPRPADGTDWRDAEWLAFEGRFGRQAATRARRLVNRHFAHDVGAAVHELRAALIPVKTAVRTLALKIDSPRARWHLSRAVDRVGYMERLVNDLRTLSQPLNSDRRRERLRGVVLEAITMAQEALGRAADQVHVEVDVSNRLTVEMTRRLLLMALANVIKNAIEAYAGGPEQPHPGQVTIRGRMLNEEQVELLVEDQGMGIAVEDLKQLRQFTPGQTSKREQGTGFGLPIARRNIQAHGGELTIDSREDEGTTVRIVLPINSQTQEEGR